MKLVKAGMVKLAAKQTELTLDDNTPTDEEILRWLFEKSEWKEIMPEIDDGEDIEQIIQETKDWYGNLLTREFLGLTDSDNPS